MTKHSREGGSVAAGGDGTQVPDENVVDGQWGTGGDRRYRRAILRNGRTVGPGHGAGPGSWRAGAGKERAPPARREAAVGWKGRPEVIRVMHALLYGAATGLDQSRCPLIQYSPRVV